uniref:Alternative protein OXSR1 n=1 Tax=Homo sapiens TaxID=9606 RepID=L8ECC0_HUMAN|nr:alternative protein OXSR1 [Homo sapiens]
MSGILNLALKRYTKMGCGSLERGRVALYRITRALSSTVGLMNKVVLPYFLLEHI